jgi:DNA-binding transcriptional LysR family regulator
MPLSSAPTGVSSRPKPFDVIFVNAGVTEVLPNWLNSLRGESRLLDGIVLAFSLEEYVAPHLASGALMRVLEDWCPPFAGFFLYYPSRRQQPAALTAVIKTLGLKNRAK